MSVKFSNLTVASFFFCWLSVAHAQAVIAPQFGDQLAEVSWQTWLIVFSYGAVGVLIRITQSLKTEELKLKAIDIFSWCLLGLFSAFATFAICESVNSMLGTRMPDLVEGALITTGAYNHKRVIGWMTDRLGAIFDAKKQGAQDEYR